MSYVYLYVGVYDALHASRYSLRGGQIGGVHAKTQCLMYNILSEITYNVSS
jgi:hypothetical protein